MSEIRRQWWKLAPQEAARAITSDLKWLVNNQSARIAQYVTSTRLYGGLHMVGLSGLTYQHLANTRPASKDRLTRNICRSVVDTVTAKIAKNKPRPLHLTDGGDWSLQYKAKRLNRLMDGVFYETHAHDLAMLAFRDACVIGDGIIHVLARNGRVVFERVLASELWVDEVEAMYGDPRVMHRLRPVDRNVLADLFPGSRKKVMAAQGTVLAQAGTTPSISDLVTVRESWHLRSGPEATDGKVIITIEDEALTDLNDWELDRFPFARLSWSPRMYGYWGQGLVEQIQPLQLELNKLLFVAQRSYQLGGTFKVLIPNGSKIVKEHINGDVGTMISYVGEPPQYITPPVLPPEMYQHMASIERQAFEEAGVSQLSSNSQKPAGLNAAVALREFNDIESDRFAIIGKRYENMFLELAELTRATIDEIVESEGSYEVDAPTPHGLDRIDYAELKPKEGECYRLQCFPVSSLPQTPAGRLETVQEYAQAGYISPEQAKRLLQFPDLEAEDSLTNASNEYLTKIFDAAVEMGDPVMIEPFDDLASARRMALQYYQRGKLQKLDEDRLELLRRALSQIDALEAQAMPPPMPMPNGAPTAPPVPQQPNELVPNATGVQNA